MNPFFSRQLPYTFIIQIISLQRIAGNKYTKLKNTGAFKRNIMALCRQSKTSMFNDEISWYENIWILWWRLSYLYFSAVHVHNGPLSHVFLQGILIQKRLIGTKGRFGQSYVEQIVILMNIEIPICQKKYLVYMSFVLCEIFTSPLPPSTTNTPNKIQKVFISDYSNESNSIV